MATETVTLDREIVERFIVEVDALGMFEIIRNGRHETPLVEHIYRIIEPFERAALGDGAREDEELHRRANERGKELAREMFGSSKDEK